MRIVAGVHQEVALDTSPIPIDRRFYLRLDTVECRGRAVMVADSQLLRMRSPRDIRLRSRACRASIFREARPLSRPFATKMLDSSRSHQQRGGNPDSFSFHRRW